jgi:hypothetical protein
MAVTVQNLFLDARALIDELSDDGTIIPESDVIDLQTKFIRFANMAQKELYKVGKLYNKYEISWKPAPNLLGLLSNFNIVDFIGTLQYYPNESGVIGAKAYYFEADGSGTVTIEENQSGTWTVLTTITIPDTVASFTAYKGLILPLGNTNPIRMKFDGTTHYRHVNRCLYSYPFATNKIPDYRPWVKIEMPANFRTLDCIVQEYPDRQYSKDPNYKWEGFRDLYINYGYEGNLRVIYKPVPTDITTITDTLEIDDITAQAITYYGAARLATFENQNLVNYFEQKYGELKLESTKEAPLGEQEIIDVYGFNGGNYGYI